jgi:hypothetical protein
MKYSFNVCDTKMKIRKGCGNCILSFTASTVQQWIIFAALQRAYPQPRYAVEMIKLDESGLPSNGW